MANNKDFKVKNGIQPTVYNEGVGTVVSGTAGYNLAGASYDSVSFSVASQLASPRGLTFKTDGTKMYLVGTTNDTVYEYTLSTAWDVSSASYSGSSLSVTSQETAPQGLEFKSDGTKLYVVGSTNDTIFEYDLSTAWDLSTATYNSVGLSISSTSPEASDISFSSDGTKVYTIDTTNYSVYQFTLSTAWDISSGSYSGKSINVFSQMSASSGLDFSSDGTKMFVSGHTTDTVFLYNLSTAWDVSTATYSGTSFSLASQEANPYTIKFSSDGTKMYTAGATNDTVYQYSTVQTTASLDLSTGAVFDYTPTSDVQVTVSNPAASGTVSSATLLLSGGATAYYDIANASYDSKNLSISAQSGQPYDVRFKSDGTAMYVVDPFVDKVFQYTLSTAWDVSTGSYASKSFTTTTQDGTPLGFDFKSDGTKMYIVGATNKVVYQYSLSTAWDVSTASYDSVSLSVTSQDSSPRSAFFKSDGTKLYIMGNTNQSIFQYSLSTAWDLSTASYDSKSFSVSAQDTNPQGVFLNSDGTKLFMQGVTNGDVYQYSLGTAYDISTASYDSVSFDLNSQIVTPFGVAFKPDGTKMYSAEFGTGEAIYQYSVASPATITYDTTLEWAGGTAPTSPAIGETDVITISTRDGGTTYQAIQAIDGAK